MSNEPTDKVSFMVNAKGFNIKRGRFRTIGGNSYTGCDPGQRPFDPIQKAPSTATSVTVFLQGASAFEMEDGTFDAIHGDAIDFSARHHDGTGKYRTVFGPLCATLTIPSYLFHVSRSTR
jgi:hypothetical protein